ncbi:MAG TPA: glycosyltransferase family 2 protein [Chitinophagales bacterium]|nr:glycosyltransferase family 2 protein [Chitinophagales bacterium]
MISAIIITFNEEKNIARCLDSLRNVADEIIVVDSFSTDNTEKICRGKNARFIQHVFEGYIEQKNFAMLQAAHHYVLSLDADECLSDELKQSVLEVKKNLSKGLPAEIKDGYTMNRLNNFCGKWIHHSGWYPDRKIRLWNRNKGKWGGVNPHDKVVMEEGSTIGFIQGDLLHYTATSIEQFKKQQERFATIAADEIFKRGKKSSGFGAYMKGMLMFVRRYFFQLGFLDGYYGWVICNEAAKYTYLKYVKAKELQ